jgi:hypothetical protein
LCIGSAPNVIPALAAWTMAVMANNRDSAPPAAAGAALRHGAALGVTAATAVAAGRVALGLAALGWPAVPARPWVGAPAGDLAARVFGRALGARDLALGLGALGALAALRQPAPGADGPSAGGPAGAGSGTAGSVSAGSAAAWLAAGALSDALDVAVTVAAWAELPRRTRWLVAASAGGAALAGAAGALALLLDRD